MMNADSGERESEGAAADRSRTRFATTTFSTDTGGGENETVMPLLADGRYRLCDQIARGGVGIVYQAQDLKLQREVAIKVLRAKFLDDAYAQQRFANEAYVMSFLPHPGLPPIYDCGLCEDGRPYHVMKLINGVTFSALLKETEPNEGEYFRIFSLICETIAFAHSHEVIHLDLKPENVMVGAFGEVHVMDWGLARFQQRSIADIPALDVEDRHTINGTPEYMAPEQARGESVDARTDVFGLGAILCEILIGRAPYRGKTVKQVFKQAAGA